jgi:hypothetical protein
MNRAMWLQDRRMQNFRDVLSRWEARELSMMEAEELLGMSERQFRRYRDRYEEDGLEGLVDGRLGKPSPKRGRHFTSEHAMTRRRFGNRCHIDAHQSNSGDFLSSLDQNFEAAEDQPLAVEGHWVGVGLNTRIGHHPLHALVAGLP